MALLTPVSLDDSRRLGALYGLTVVAARPILAGSVNTNVALELADGDRAFLRVYEEQTFRTAAGEARLLTHLATGGVPTPRPLERTDGGFISEQAGKPVAIFPWVEGEVLCQARVTASVAAQVGEALATVHRAGASLDGAPPSRFGPEALAARLRDLRRTPLPGALSDVVTRLSQRLERFAGRAGNAGGVGLVHGDLFRDNVLWNEGRIAALLDFESASQESYAFDFMVTLLAWCFGTRLDLGLAHAMAQGYTRVRPIPDADAQRLHDEGCFAALRFSITRITDFELRPRGSGVFKDYRRFLARMDALDALGTEGLRAALGV